jgi:hypothetical protein
VQAVWKTGAPQPADDAVDEEAEESDIEPGRGLVGLWPSLLGGSDQGDNDEGPIEARAEEDTVHAVPERERAPPIANADAAALFRPGSEPAVLPRDHLRKLKATLGELSECRRLIEAALRDEVDVSSFGQS